MGLTAEAEKTRVPIAPLGLPSCDYAIVTVSAPHRSRLPYNWSRKIVLLVRTFNTAQSISLNAMHELVHSYGGRGWCYTKRHTLLTRRREELAWRANPCTR